MSCSAEEAFCDRWRAEELGGRHSPPTPPCGGTKANSSRQSSFGIRHYRPHFYCSRLMALYCLFAEFATYFLFFVHLILVRLSFVYLLPDFAWTTAFMRNCRWRLIVSADVVGICCDVSFDFVFMLIFSRGCYLIRAASCVHFGFGFTFSIRHRSL